MKYSPRLYARAFVETVAAAPGEKQGRLLVRFLQVIKKNGDWPLRKKIFRQTRKLMIKKAGGRIITLEFAREVSKEPVEKLQNSFSAKDYIETTVRPELLAGVRILIDEDRELDFTLKKKLRKLFNAT